MPTSLVEAAQARRARLCSRLGAQPALIPAGSLVSRNYPANHYPFRASSHFLYFVGLGFPGAALWMCDDEHWLLVPDRDPHADLWHAPPPTPEELAALTGLKVGSIARLAALCNGRNVACTPLVHAADRAQFAALLKRTPEGLGASEEPDGPLLDAIVALRLQHDAAAQLELRRAAELTVQAHQLGMRVTRPLAIEREVASAMAAVFARAGATTAYGSIVSVHGEILHNEAQNGVMHAGDLLLADVGAETDSGYAADVTRTWPVSGRFSATQRALYQLVLATQRAVIAEVRPAVRFRDLHLLAARTLTAGLVDLGILRGNVDDLVERGCHALFMPHGLGHLLGLDVHDMEDLGDRAGYAAGRARSPQFGLSYLRLDRDLAPGMLVTIEPGFYQVPLLRRSPESVGLDLRDVNLTRLAQFGDVRGIRIEDDVLVTEDGHEVLTATLAKDPDDVETQVSSDA